MLSCTALPMLTQIGAKKKGSDIARLVCTAGTGFFYVVRKTKTPIKLELRKYDPRVRRHVLFTMTKMK